MEKLVFSCDWEKNRERSWSGTHWGLFSSLKKYFDVEDCDLSANLYISLARNAGRAMRKVFCYYDLAYLKVRIANEIVKNVYDSGTCVFGFDESFCKSNTHNYIYLDLSVGYLKSLYNCDRRELLASGFQVNSEFFLNRREALQREYLEKAQAIFTMGKWLENEMVYNYGLPKEKVFHVGGGINVDVSHIDTSKKNGNKILFVGRDFERKNGPLVVDAFKLAYEKRKDIELYIAGPLNLQEKHPGIKCLGDCRYQELVAYFNMCDIFCMPSKFEAYGLVFPEALCFGLPCIGRNAYEMPFFIEDGKTGYLLNEDSPQKLADMMLDLLNNDVIKKNVISKRQEYIEKYSWDAVAKRIYEIISAKEYENGTNQY